MGCRGPVDGRRGVVQASAEVDAAELARAVDALREATQGDTDLRIGACQAGDFCIRVDVLDGDELPPNANGSADPRPEGSRVFVHRERGNVAGTLAHELIHAIGVEAHVDTAPENEHELMFERRMAPDRFFGPATARLYAEAFGFEPDTSAVVVF